MVLSLAKPSMFIKAQRLEKQDYKRVKLNAVNLKVKRRIIKRFRVII